SIRKRDDHFALTFPGYIDIERDGIYTFNLAASGAAKLFISSTQVTTIGLTKGPRTARGDVALQSGKHTFRLDYYHLQGQPNLSLTYLGPGISQQPIPPSKLYHSQNDSIASPLA